jgi:hypothetical protein
MSNGLVERLGTGCTDIDDALHVVDLPNGNYEVGVHIADVRYGFQSLPQTGTCLTLSILSAILSKPTLLLTKRQPSEEPQSTYPTAGVTTCLHADI